MMNDGIEYSDPRSILEDKEDRNSESINEEILRECASRFGCVLVWLVAGETLADIGERTLIAAKKIRPELVDGAAFEAIAKLRGKGRSAPHKLAMEFESIFGIKSANDKSAEARKKYANSWGRK